MIYERGAHDKFRKVVKVVYETGGDVGGSSVYIA